MNPISFKRHRFPPVIIQHAVWLYARFTLSFRDVEELLAERPDRKRSKLSRGELTPFSERGRAVLLEDIAAIEVAFVIEMVMDRGMDGGELLQGALSD